MKVYLRQIERELANIRAISEDTGKYFEGYAAVFNQRSKPIMENNKVFYEIIDPKAFDEILATNPDVRLLYNHERNNLLARTKSGTLTLSVDDIGLKFRASVPNTSLGNDTYEMVLRNDLPDCSFAFYVRKGDDVWTKDDAGNNIRTILRISRLVDVSIVDTGAYSDTTISARDNIITITINEGDQQDEPLPGEPTDLPSDLPMDMPVDASLGMDFEILGKKAATEYLAAYPWDQCIADQQKKGLSLEAADKVCGWIKANNSLKMPNDIETDACGTGKNTKRLIPQPGDTQETFIAKCIKHEMDKGVTTDSKQAAAICYGIWDKRSVTEKDKMKIRIRTLKLKK